MAAKQQLTLSAITGSLAGLSRAELEELAEIINALLAATETNSQPSDKSQEQQPEKVAKGYLESKIINGCGPYLYLRYWAGRVHKSVYVGKAPPPAD